MQMLQRLFNFRSAEHVRLESARESVIHFLQTPIGFEFIADALRSMRRVRACNAEPQFLAELSAMETRFRTASARPLPPGLGLGS